MLATRLGLAAVDAADGGAWGTMPALKGTCIELVPLSDAVADLRTVPVEDYAAAETFFGRECGAYVRGASTVRDSWCGGAVAAPARDRSERTEDHALKRRRRRAEHDHVAEPGP